MVESGHIRLDGRRVTRSSCAVHAGATLVLPVGERIEVIRLLSLPLRRGPAAEAQACYRRLDPARSEEHTSELQSLMRISYAVFCLKKKKYNTNHTTNTHEYKHKV